MSVKKIHIYDLDDTLFINKPFAHFIDIGDGEFIDVEKHYPQHFKNAQKIFLNKIGEEIKFQKINDFIIPLNSKTEKPYLEKTKEKIEEKTFKNSFEVKDGIIVMRAFRGFHSDPTTFGRELNKHVFESYEKSMNKMILTGRDEKLRTVLLNLFEELEFEKPNFGLKMYSTNIGIMKWKANEILNSIKEFGWGEIHFYEDRKEWLDYAEQQILDIFPEVKFIGNYVDNIKKSHKLF